MVRLTADDRLDIVELLSIYAWAIDHKEGGLFAQVFTEDVEATYPMVGAIRTLEAITAYMDAFHRPFDGTHHLVANPWVSVVGDDVVLRSYVTLTMVVDGCPGGDLFAGGGYYVDRVVRTLRGWRIASRDVRNVWRGGNPKVMELGREAVAHLV